jgi:hypothetical protein
MRLLSQSWESRPSARAVHKVAVSGGWTPLARTLHMPEGLARRSLPESSGRVGWGRAWFRPMASDVSALSSIVANGHQVLPAVPPPPRFIPYGGFSPVRLETQPSRTVPFRRRLRRRLTPGLRSFRVRLRVQTSRFAAGPTGPWLSAVYHARTSNRYYGLMRQSDELRPAWACSACSGRSLPSRAVRLTFPSFLCHTVHACCDLYPVG